MATRSCVIVVENLPIELDRHVWQQAQALHEHGWHVSVICPQAAEGDAPFEVIDGIEINRHPLREARRTIGFVREYASAIAHQARLLAKIYRRRPFSVIHACNPPDLILPFCLPYKLLGVQLVFDQHDLAPEIMEVRSGKGLLYRAVLFAEWCSFRSADVVLSSNETFRQLALGRGGRRPDRVHVVHTVPDLTNMRLVEPDRRLRGDRRVVIGYLGIIGVQDGLDHLVRATAELVGRHGLTDFRVVVVGDGPALAETRALATELGIDDHVTFAGYMRGEALWAQLSDFDIGVIPDPVNAFNDKISMNKVFEYSALGVPSVCYPLTETMRLLGAAGTYSADATPAGLADALARLVQDDALRATKGRESQELADRSFSWDTERASLLAAYDGLVPAPAAPLAIVPG